MSTNLSSDGAAVAIPVGSTANSVVAAASSPAAPLVLALPTILPSPFPPFP